RSTVREPAPVVVTEASASVTPEAPAAEVAPVEASEAPAADTPAPEAPAPETVAETPPAPPSDEPERPRRSGWWNRKLFGA
ncbi:hypothetical protein, partial [Ancylobacter sp. G4_0304]|uniref:hypothetical protein n=1 Tax=Ancylobacter sp. G4_0304 TaxID=3114289 RepID=UPI0039C67C03